MSSARTILCPCEDVTLGEVADAIRDGHRGLEAVKRVTGLATGTCQGRQCVVPCLRALARLDPDHEPGERLMTFRPPARPPTLGDLGGDPA